MRNQARLRNQLDTKRAYFPVGGRGRRKQLQCLQEAKGQHAVADLLAEVGDRHATRLQIGAPPAGEGLQLHAAV